MFSSLKKNNPIDTPSTSLEYIGRFKLIQELGKGAQGIVYLAEDTQLGRNVAIKTIDKHQDDAEQLIFGFHQVNGGPIVRWVPCGHLEESSSNSWAWINENEFSLSAPLAVEGNVSGWATSICMDHGFQEVTSFTENFNQIKIQVDNEKPGWLFIGNVWYPGWHANVDGRDVPVFRADYLFQTVPVPAGAETVLLSFHPNSIVIGALASLSGVLMVWFLIWFTKIEKK